MLAYLKGFEDPNDFSECERYIREEFDLYNIAYNPEYNQRQYDHAVRLLTIEPRLANIMIFHGNGHIREVSLNKLERRLEFPVSVYGLFCRLNDWGEPVRSAAWKAFSSCLQNTPAETLMPAVCLVLQDGHTWKRWQGGFVDLIDQITSRSELLQLLTTRLMSDHRNGTGRIFQSLSRSSNIDDKLEEIARRAAHPQIRAMAIRYLSCGTVAWPTGKKRRNWIDKSSGRFRDVPTYDSRPITVPYNLPEIIRNGIHDRSTFVRKQSLDALILHRQDPTFHNLISESLFIFAEETRPTFKERIDFLQRNQLEKL
ncbi:hypothetical protein CQ054_06695 [Ochrobactrum sp. MYb29]|nr:hypothetical protein CQ054_06695 [Ochrobactrum sp. MYb29]